MRTVELPNANQDQRSIPCERVEFIVSQTLKGAMQIIQDKSKEDFEKLEGLTNLIISLGECFANEVKKAK